MPIVQPRVIVDTNVLLAGLASKSSAAQRVVDLLQSREVIPLTSTAVLAEYRVVLMNPVIAARFPGLTPRRVEVALQRLTFLADHYRIVRSRFKFARDPLDAKFIELAIEGSATHLITLDNDLLSLSVDRTDAGKRFRQRLPKLTVQRPLTFLGSLTFGSRSR